MSNASFLRLSLLRRGALALTVASALACGTPPSNTDAGGTPDASSTDDSATPPADAAPSDDATTPPADAAPGEDATSAPDAPVNPMPDASTGDTMNPTPDAMSSGPCMPTGGATPDLMGPEACSTLAFGRDAANVMTVASPITFTGGTIPPGIYDAVGLSRTEGSLMTSLRATLVLGSDGRYTEVRTLSTGSGTPPVTRKSGTWTTEMNTLVRSATCGGATNPEANRLTYRVECTGDTVLLHMGTTNLWFTYRRR